MTKRVRGRRFGDVDVAEVTYQGGHDPTMLLTEDTLEVDVGSTRPPAGSKSTAHRG